MSIRRTAADAAFSLAVREYANHTCENCGAVGRTECSHFYGRRFRSLRWEPLNCAALCHFCHRTFTEDPDAHTRWFRSRVGWGVMEILRERRNQVYKLYKGEEKDIAKHYREQVRNIQEARDNGEEPELVSWY